jgi:hypothetical protein
MKHPTRTRPSRRGGTAQYLLMARQFGVGSLILACGRARGRPEPARQTMQSECTSDSPASPGDSRTRGLVLTGQSKVLDALVDPGHTAV